MVCRKCDREVEFINVPNPRRGQSGLKALHVEGRRPRARKVNDSLVSARWQRELRSRLERDCNRDRR